MWGAIAGIAAASIALALLQQTLEKTGACRACARPLLCLTVEPWLVGQRSAWTAAHQPNRLLPACPCSGLAEKQEKPKQLQEPGPDFKTKPGEGTAAELGGSAAQPDDI